MLPFAASRGALGACDTPASWSVSLGDRGLVCGDGSVLARGEDEREPLRLEPDRIVAMLSVVAGEPLQASAILPPIEAAAAHWRRGDKALANLRLIFARLPRPGDVAAVERLAQVERLLDGGLAPSRLIQALSPLRAETLVRRYDPNEPRVPAGTPDGGRWTFAEAPGSATPRPIRIVQNDGDTTEEPELPWPSHDRVVHGASRNDAPPHHLPPLFDPLTGLPGGPALAARRAAIEKAAKDALETVGPGTGPVHGTAVHTQFKKNIEALGEPHLAVEQSYRNGALVPHFARGSVRADMVIGRTNKPIAAPDLKTGRAPLTPSRLRQLQRQITDGGHIHIYEVKP